MNYTAKIKVLGKTYEAKGESAADAISHLEPGRAKGIAVLTISNGEKSKSKLLPASQVMRLFSLSKLMREIALRNTSLMFDAI